MIWPTDNSCLSCHLDWPQNLGRDANDNRVFGHVAGYDCSSADDGTIADGHAREDGRTGTNPDVPADVDRRWVQIRSLFRILTVIQRCHDHIVADERAVSNCDAALVLEAAAAVDEDIPPDVEILATIRIEGREQAEALIDWPPNQPREYLPHFLLIMVAAIEAPP